MATLTIQTTNNVSHMSTLSPDFNYPPGASFIVGLSGGGDPAYRAIGIFDFSALPAGAVISSAVLTLVATIAYGSKVSKVNRILRADTSMANFTWNNYKPLSAWTTPGAGGLDTDYTTLNEVEFTPAVGEVNINITDIVKFAQANTAKIVYLRIKQNAETGSEERSVYRGSTYAVDESLRPKLVIEYTVAETTDKFFMMFD